MRKKWLSLLLALAMLPGLLIPTASADTVNLSDKTVTLSVTPSQSTICVGSTGDVYVTYTISIASNDGATPIPAFSFVVPTDDKLATTATDPVWRFQLNTKLKQSQEGPYNTVDYNPTTGYVGVGGSDNNGIIEKTTVMTIVAKFEKNSVTTATTHTLEPTEFIAGGGETVGSSTGSMKVSNAFGTCTVNGATVTVKAGATVSGTVKDDKGTAVSGATVTLTGGTEKTATTDGSGKYTFSDVSTGTYTVKAKSSDGSLNGSASVTVKADSISNADVTIAKGVTVSGTAVSWNAESNAVYLLYPSATSDEDIRAKWKNNTYADGTALYTGTGGAISAKTVDGKSMQAQTFSFDTVAAGDYKLAIFKPGKYVPKIVSITVDSTDHDCGQLKLWLYGDVNYDGKIRTNDATMIYQSIAKIITLSDEQFLASDVNQDSKIRTNDATEIYKKVANKASLFDSMV